MSCEQSVLTSRDIPPAPRTSLEFELMIRHPISYPIVSPEPAPPLTVHHAQPSSPQLERDGSVMSASTDEATGSAISHVLPLAGPVNKGRSRRASTDTFIYPQKTQCHPKNRWRGVSSLALSLQAPRLRTIRYPVANSPWSRPVLRRSTRAIRDTTLESSAGDN